MTMKGRILIVDDKVSTVTALMELLRSRGYEVTSVEAGAAAVDLVRREAIGLTLLDLKLGGEDGLDVLPKLKKECPEMSVIILTGKGTIENAFEALGRGADYFIEKNIRPPSFLTIVEKGLEAYRLRCKSIRLERLTVPSQPEICCRPDGAMSRLIKQVELVAGEDATVLLLGETGTGKGLLAHFIHNVSTRKREPFVEVDCTTLPREIVESELFGSQRGAFSGAVTRMGLVEAANGGTLFLDEIGELDTSMQAKLLRLLEQKRIRRLGGVTEIEVDVRLIAATHRDLAKEMAEGRFRKDLFYRLHVFTIDIPPLRARREEILPLVLHFLREFRGAQVFTSAISPAAEETLLNYDWPGNVRELRNVMKRAVILCPPGSAIMPAHLPRLGAASAVAPPANAGTDFSPSQPNTTHTGGFSSLSRVIEEFEREYLKAALEFHHWNKNVTAQALDISRATLYEKIGKYNLSPEV
ncbi:MAG: sigma-54-dependent Fis family transcriptional regulator [Acidobacteria bacterium]|nr:sigma-54-dependent Fis family transcriptional regulator [Acidobacteriota bacterium]